MKLNIELTDTFQGEANYSWVKREELELPSDSSDLTVVRRVKKLMGYAGVRSITENTGDMIKLDFSPSGLCHVIFVTFE